ncbi:YdcF family protein [Latilactobacillus sakei]|uniref:YdcF family protein n=1 Tax=Latilactobacillus sakei TaxID=1599 RepID=UPI001F095F8D|nr:YdcF family protein [Latilactobacillus sakei]
MNTFIDHFYILPLIFLALFVGLQLTEKRRFINGIVFNGFLATAVGELAILVFQSDSRNVYYIALAAAIVAFLIILFFYLFGFLLFLWNAYIVWKKESHTLSNMLTLFIGLGLIALFFVPMLANLLHVPEDLRIFIGTISTVFLLYIPLFFYLYLSSLIIYLFNRPRYNQDYIIVLGSGLIDGQYVPPLLASRIERAMTFYHRQVKKGRPAPKLVFPGGQGGDEKLPESVAMQRYAIDHGIPVEQTLTEEKSVNTLQNMQFSKQIIEADTDKDKPRIIFSTNNYHTFRAGLFAKQAHLKADGIGAKTSKYFLPNATIREFIAILSMKRHQLLFVTICSLLFAILAVLLNHLN